MVAPIAAGDEDGQDNRIRTGIPAEFLDLVEPAIDAERTRPLSDGELFVEFHVEGVRRGDVIIAIKDGDLRFDDPVAAAALITDLQNSEDLVALFEDGFHRNDPAFCVVGTVTPCQPPTDGRLGLVLDTEALRLDLFRSNRYRLPPPRIMPSHPKAAGLVSGLTARVSGSDQNNVTTINSSLSFDTIAGRGRDSLFANGSVNEDGEVSVLRAGAQTFRGRGRAAAGLFLSEASDLFTQRDLVGVEYHTSDLTLDQSSGFDDTPLLLFLARPAQVDVFRDGQLLYSAYLEAGPQTLPTRRFPAGSYNVTIRIRSENGEEREERQFFSRTSFPGTARQVHYSLQAGMVRDRGNGGVGDDEAGEPFLAARMSVPWRRNLDLSARAGLLGQTAFAEAVSTVRFDRASLAVSALSASDGVVSAGARLSGFVGPLNVSGNLRHATSGENGFEPTARGAFSEATLNVSGPMPFLGGTISGFGRYSEQDDRDARNSFGATWTRSIPTVFDRVNTQFSLNFQDTDTDTRLTATLRFSRLQQRSTISGSLTGRNVQASSGDRFDHAQNLQWSRRSDHRAATPWSISTRTSNTSDGDPQAGLSGQLQSARYIADGRVDYTFSDEGRATFFGSAATSFAATVDGGFAFAGRRNAKAGVLVDLRDEPASIDISASVNRGRLKPVRSQLTFMPVPEIQSQLIRLRPSARGAVAYDGGVIRVAAFPGNVIPINPSFLRQVTIFGLLTDTDGTPLGDARLTVDGDTFVVDEGGYFVFDVLSTLSEIKAIAPDGGVCTIPLPDLSVSGSEDFTDLGDLVCNAQDD
ncbi:MAG: TcfC E-set like domain-containing protein [Henriciella sp.]|nr:TcfC E-set like domain-containing protein [Henriciella sp.]